MNPVRTRSDGADIVYDADLFGKIDAAFFDPEFWRARGALAGMARGRGTTWFVRDENHRLALRHYRRGGMLAPWLGDRYLWLGLERTRAFGEWRLLADMFQRGLPVPRPAAARVRRRGACYRADLITLRIQGARALSTLLADAELGADRWRAIGRCLRRFHDDRMCHADLNAHNILLAGELVYVVDWDRGRRREPGVWRNANLARLKRSLDKLAAQQPHLNFSPSDWQALLAGYDPPGAGHSSASAAR